jgi:hypothetical protein
MTWGTLALSADNPEIDDSSVRLLMELNQYSFSLFQFGLALFVLAAAIVVLRTGVLWRWLAAIGLIAAVLQVVGAAWTIDGDEEGVLSIFGLIGAPVTMLFVLLSAINMIVMKEEPPPTERTSIAA